MAHKYSSLKLFHYGDQLEALRANEVRAPIHIRIKPENACNHKCWFCAYRVDHLALGEDMSLRDRIPADKMKEIVADILEMGVKAVTFSGGGEPLVYKHLVPTIRALGEGGVKVGALTNGTYLCGDIADAFAQYGSWIRVSMDYWDGPSLQESRKVKPAEFDKIIANMRAFAARDTKCVLGVSFIVSKGNHHRVQEFCTLMKDIGVDHVKISGCVVSSDGRTNNEYHSEFSESVRLQIDEATRLSDENFAVVDHYHALAERFDKPYETCHFLTFLTVIGADLKVYSCQDKAYTASGTLGSIKETSFKEFWFSEQNHARIQAINPSYDCQHHCVTHAKNELIGEYLNVDQDHADFV